MAIDFAPPEGTFYAELKLLAVEAEDTQTAFKTANRLPADFPAASLFDICESFIGLKDGTSQNAGWVS